MARTPKHPHRTHLPNAQTKSSRPVSQGKGGGLWLYGWHAVNAALANPERVIVRIIGTEAAVEKLVLPTSTGKRRLPNPHLMDGREVDRILGAESVHQGIGIEVLPLEPWTLDDILNIERPRGPIVILDQVSDPHNVGAVLRSAAAYDAIAVVLPKDHSAPETPTMAKAASGALDMVPRVVVTNLSAAMRELKEAGWWIIGLEGEATKELPELTLTDKTVLVLGAEGRGMRRLTSESCDERVRLPMGSRMESLNVSNAAAVALYHFYCARR